MRIPFIKKSINQDREYYIIRQMVDAIFPYSANKSELMRRAKGTVYACCTYIANDACRVPLKLYTTKPSSKSSKISKAKTEYLKSDMSGIGYRLKAVDEVEEVADDDALQLLWKPNNYISYSRLFSLTLFHLLLTGDAYWQLAKGPMDIPRAIHVMPPDQCQITEKKDAFREIERYTFGKTNYTPEQIIHFTLLNPAEDGWKSGMSPLQSVLEDDKIMEQIRALRKSLADTNPTTSFYVEQDKDAKLTPDQRESLKKAITEYRLGKQKFDDVMVVSGGKLVPFPTAGSDIPFQTDMTILREFIANAYKIPITKFTSASNRAERDTSNIEYYASAVTPHLIELQEMLNSFYLPAFNTDNNLFFAFDDCIPDDEALQMRVDTGYVNAGIKTINEVRYERNFGEGVDGGDDHYIPSNMMPIGNMALQDQVRTAIAEIMKQFGDK